MQPYPQTCFSVLAETFSLSPKNNMHAVITGGNKNDKSPTEPAQDPVVGPCLILAE
jgi:hypothetical protein